MMILWCGLLVLSLMLPAFSGRAAASSAAALQGRGDASDLFSLRSPSVLVVEGIDDGGTVVSQGSGVSVLGWVVTNNHVIASATDVRVRQAGHTWRAMPLVWDEQNDLAMLWAYGLHVPTVPIRDSATLEIGERVYAVGAPEGLELTLSEGLVSAIRPRGEGIAIQTTAPISRGSSGGGLFDREGRLVGITTFQLEEGQNLNFAVPADLLLHYGPRASGETADRDSWVATRRKELLAAGVMAGEKAVQLEETVANLRKDDGLRAQGLNAIANAGIAAMELGSLASDWLQLWTETNDSSIQPGLATVEESLRALYDLVGPITSVSSEAYSIVKSVEAILGIVEHALHVDDGRPLERGSPALGSADMLDALARVLNSSFATGIAQRKVFSHDGCEVRLDVGESWSVVPLSRLTSIEVVEREHRSLFGRSRITQLILATDAGGPIQTDQGANQWVTWRLWDVDARSPLDYSPLAVRVKEALAQAAEMCGREVGPSIF